MGRSLVHMDDSGEDILLSNTIRNEVKSRLEIRFLCYPAFYLVLNHATFKQIKKRHNINYSDGFYIGLLYAVPLVLS